MSTQQPFGPVLYGLKILVVDDQEQIRSLIRQALENCGVTVIDAGTGEEALAQSRRHHVSIDLAIIDFIMPGLSGLDLAVQLGHDLPNLKILYMSSAIDSIAMESLQRRSPELVLLKPFAISELVQRVRSLLADGPGSAKIQA